MDLERPLDQELMLKRERDDCGFSRIYWLMEKNSDSKSTAGGVLCFSEATRVFSVGLVLWETDCCISQLH